MNEKDSFGFFLEGVEPLQEIGSISMSGAAEELFDLGADGTQFAMDPYLRSALEDLATQRPFTLKTNKNDGGFRLADVLSEVMLDSTRGAHSGCGQDHGRGLVTVDHF